MNRQQWTGQTAQSLALRAGIVASLLACNGLATAQEVGGGSKGAVTGAAGGATADGANARTVIARVSFMNTSCDRGRPIRELGGI